MGLARNLLTAIFIVASTSVATAQTVDLPWLQQAGVACGGGLNVEAQGGIESALLKRLTVVNVGAEGTYQQSDVEKLLDQFKQEERNQIYTNYVECLLTLMATASSASNLLPKEIKLTSQVAVAALDILQRGQRTVLKVGDVVSINDHSKIISITTVNYLSSGSPYVDFVWSDSQVGKDDSERLGQGQLLNWGEGCSVAFYKIDVEEKTVSILNNC